MKRLASFVLALLVAIPVLAKIEEDPSISVYSSSDGIVSVDVLGHFGWGYHVVSADSFSANSSGEVFFNVAKLKITPIDAVSLQAGVDCKWTYFGSASYLFYQHEHMVNVSSFSTAFSGQHWDKSYSSVNIFSLSAPAVLKFNLGPITIGGGAEANFNISGETYYRLRSEDIRTEVTESKAKLNTFTYDFIGMVGFNDLSVYAKFYPKGTSMIAGDGVPFSYWTLGVMLSL